MSEFRNLVDAHFGFLVEEFGFMPAVTNRERVHYSSPTCVVGIDLEHGISNAWISLRPPPNAAHSASALSVLLVANCRGFKGDSGPKYRDLDTRMIEEIELFARLLRDYCGDLLSGDFARWPEIVTCVRALPMSPGLEKFR